MRLSCRKTREDAVHLHRSPHLLICMSFCALHFTQARSATLQRESSSYCRSHTTLPDNSQRAVFCVMTDSTRRHFACKSKFIQPHDLNKLVNRARPTSPDCYFADHRQFFLKTSCSAVRKTVNTCYQKRSGGNPSRFVHAVSVFSSRIVL